jgi:uncharacterized protein
MNPQMKMAALAALLVTNAVACERDGSPPAELPPPVAFDTATARIETMADTLRVRVEIAERDEQRAYGLMERTSLLEDAGMIFLYRQQQPGSAGFWMYRTRIPLDIAFLDGDGTIVAILAMEPCPSPDPRWCPTYAPEVPYHAALEMNLGWFARNQVRVGDRVILERAPAGA